MVQQAHKELQVHKVLPESKVSQEKLDLPDHKGKPEVLVLSDKQVSKGLREVLGQPDPMEIPVPQVGKVSPVKQVRPVQPAVSDPQEVPDPQVLKE